MRSRRAAGSRRAEVGGGVYGRRQRTVDSTLCNAHLCVVVDKGSVRLGVPDTSPRLRQMGARVIAMSPTRCCKVMAAGVETEPAGGAERRRGALQGGGNGGRWTERTQGGWPEQLSLGSVWPRGFAR